MKWIDLIFAFPCGGWQKQRSFLFIRNLWQRNLNTSIPTIKKILCGFIITYLIDIQDQSSITNTAFLSIEILQFIFKTSLSRPIAVLYHIDSDKNKRSVGYNIVPLSTNGSLGLRWFGRNFRAMGRWYSVHYCDLWRDRWWRRSPGRDKMWHPWRHRSKIVLQHVHEKSV